MIYQRIGFQPSASLVQQTPLQCFKQKLTNYHHNLVSMPHPQQLVPDQQSEDWETQFFLTSIICCQPSRCDAMSWTDINTSEWWWKRAHTLEEMLGAVWDCFMQSSLFLSQSPCTSLAGSHSPVAGKPFVRVDGLSSCTSHQLNLTGQPAFHKATWLGWGFQFPQIENCLSSVHQSCICAQFLFSLCSWARRTEGIRWRERGGFL